MRSLLLPVIAGAFLASAFSFTPTQNGLYAVFDTSKGEFVVRLAYDAVPLTVGNFVGLAEGAIPWKDPETEAIRTDSIYDGTEFYQVIRGRHIWAGDPLQNGEGKGHPGYGIPAEMHPHLIPTRGAIVMYNRYNPEGEKLVDIGENTGGSEFFVLLSDDRISDGRYSTFGYVYEGMDVVDAIGNVEVDNKGKPKAPVLIHSIEIVRKGEAAEAFDLKDLELPRLGTQTSADLSNWNDAVLGANESLQSKALELAQMPSGSGAGFARYHGMVVPDYASSLDGATFSVTLTGNWTPLEWVHEFNAGGLDSEETYGPVKIGSSSNAARILVYEYHRLPYGGRLKIVTTNGQMITYFLRFTSESDGNTVAWVDDLPTGNRFVGVGTFSLSPRP